MGGIALRILSPGNIADSSVLNALGIFPFVAYMVMNNYGKVKTVLLSDALNA
jgi:hypothetical protein